PTHRRPGRWRRPRARRSGRPRHGWRARAGDGFGCRCRGAGGPSALLLPGGDPHPWDPGADPGDDLVADRVTVVGELVRIAPAGSEQHHLVADPVGGVGAEVDHALVHADQSDHRDVTTTDPYGDAVPGATGDAVRSEEHTSELQSRFDLVCR